MVVHRLTEEHEPNLVDVGRSRPHSADGDARRVIGGPAVDTGGNSRERDSRRLEVVGDAQALAVARGQQLRPVVRATVDRADGVNDPPRLEISCGCCDSLTSRETAAKMPGAKRA